MPTSTEEAKIFYKEIKGVADANVGSDAVLSLSERHASWLLEASSASGGAVIVDETVEDSPKFSIKATDLVTVVESLEEFAENPAEPKKGKGKGKPGKGKEDEPGKDDEPGKSKEGPAKDDKGHEKHDKHEHR